MKPVVAKSIQKSQQYLIFCSTTRSTDSGFYDLERS